MRRTISERKALKMLGIPNFRYMSKDKIIKFASMIPYMDPEVAKRAIEQFPEFKSYALDVVNCYQGIVNKIFEENTASQKVFYDVCTSIIESLREELRNDSITSEDRSRIEDKMMEIARMIGEKDTENKQFNLKILSGAGAFLLGVIFVGSNLLGSIAQLKSPTNSNDEDDYVEVD